MMWKGAVFALAVLALLGCAPTTESVLKRTSSLSGDQAEQIAADHRNLNAFLGGKTIRSYGAGHGNQIEFIAKDGSVWLWYPGNSIILPGEWDTRPLSSAGGTSLCFRYGPNTYNPVTKVVGSEWQCSDGADWLRGIPEIIEGDPLRLRRARPFELWAHPETSLAQLASQAGLPEIKKPNLVNVPGSQRQN